MKILAGDIGGTNTRLQGFDTNGSELKPVGKPTIYKNAEHANLDVILSMFASGEQYDRCVIGVAGPVNDRRAKMTNIPHWPELSADGVASQLGLDHSRAALVNDMFAHGASLDAVIANFPQHYKSVRAGVDASTATRLLVMPGTGLGTSFLVWDEHVRSYRPIPSEGGHLGFTPKTPQQDAILVSMRKLLASRGEHSVTNETIVCGGGLPNLYACLKNPSDPASVKQLTAKEISDADGTDPIATQTLDLFAEIMGAAIGNYVCVGLTRGGIFLAGNIATIHAKRLSSKLLLDALDKTGPVGFQAWLPRIPIHLITYEDTGLLGAANYAATAL